MNEKFWVVLHTPDIRGVSDEWWRHKRVKLGETRKKEVRTSREDGEQRERLPHKSHGKDVNTQEANSEKSCVLPLMYKGLKAAPLARRGVLHAAVLLLSFPFTQLCGYTKGLFLTYSEVAVKKELWCFVSLFSS